jgi:hypothetical protein
MITSENPAIVKAHKSRSGLKDPLAHAALRVFDEFVHVK